MGNKSSRDIFSGVCQQLITTTVDSSDQDCWDDLWKSAVTTADVFELLTHEDVVQIIQDRPDNLRLLFTQAVAQLYQVVETPYPVYFDQALNCLRILARILPTIIQNNSAFVQELLWDKQIISIPVDPSEGSAASEAKQETEPLAVILVNTMFHLLFLPDFTIEDPNTDFSEADINSPEFKSALMWAPGVGSIEKSIAASSPYDKNRIEVLRMMIAAFSDSLFQKSESYDTCNSLWLEVATSVDTPYAEVVFCSLMNIVLGYDPVGWGLPYGNLVTTDTAKELSQYAIQVLIILLDYGYPLFPIDTESGSVKPISQSSQTIPYVSADDTDAQGFNVFRRLLQSVNNPDSLNFIFKGFVRLLNNIPQSDSKYLPGSISKIENEQELLLLLWKCLEEMPYFVPYIMNHCDICDIVVPICYYLVEHRRDVARMGECYLCTFILLKLSGERNFGVSLNKAYANILHPDLPLFSSTANHADLLIIVLHKVIVSGLEKLSSLYNCFLTIICNISPYTKSLCNMSSVKLVNLFQLFTSPRFLYVNEGNHVFVTMILETFNNILQYQYEGNYHIVYAIIRRREIFEALSNLTLPAAIKFARELSERAINKKTLKSSSHGKRQQKALNAASDTSAKASSQGTDSGNSNISEGKSSEAENDADIDDKKQDSNASRDVDLDDDADVDLKVQNPRRFMPTVEWLESVKSDLPMNTILRLLMYLIPQLDEFMKRTGNGILDEAQVIEFIRQTTMVGLLPVPHPLVIRKYQSNKYTSAWFSSYMWGVIYMQNQDISLFEGLDVKLFTVQPL